MGVASAAVKKDGVFTIPGLCRLKIREACHQGRQEGDLRQDVHCQGQARKKDCQGLPRCGPEGKHLSVLAMLQSMLLACLSWGNPRDWLSIGKVRALAGGSCHCRSRRSLKPAP